MSSHLAKQSQTLKEQYQDIFKVWVSLAKKNPFHFIFSCIAVLLTVATTRISFFLTPVMHMPEPLSSWQILLVIMLTLGFSFLFTLTLHWVYDYLNFGRASYMHSFRLALHNFIFFAIAVMIANVMVILGLGLMIVPGLIMLVLYSMIAPLTICENYGPFEALKRSWFLVAQHFWRTLAVVMAPSALSIAVLVGFEQMLGFGALRLHWVAFTLLQVVIETVAISWLTIAIVIQFNDLKIRQQEKEMHSLAHDVI